MSHSGGWLFLSRGVFVSFFNSFLVVFSLFFSFVSHLFFSFLYRWVFSLLIFSLVGADRLSFPGDEVWSDMGTEIAFDRRGPTLPAPMILPSKSPPVALLKGSNRFQFLTSTLNTPYVAAQRDPAKSLTLTTLDTVP